MTKSVFLLALIFSVSLCSVRFLGNFNERSVSLQEGLSAFDKLEVSGQSLGSDWQIDQVNDASIKNGDGVFDWKGTVEVENVNTHQKKNIHIEVDEDWLATGSSFTQSDSTLMTLSSPMNISEFIESNFHMPSVFENVVNTVENQGANQVSWDVIIGEPSNQQEINITVYNS